MKEGSLGVWMMRTLDGEFGTYFLLSLVFVFKAVNILKPFPYF